ncbi:HAD family hydrolase [Dermacoccaceae bacterium W4C1]
MPADRPRLVASDLDGTLLASDGTVSPRTARAWARLAQLGIESVLVTARPPRWIDPLASIVGEHGLAICTNGAFVYDVGQRTLVEQHGMDRAAVLQIVTRLREAFPDIGFAVESPEGLYREPAYADPHAEELPGMPLLPIEQLPSQVVVGKLLAIRPGPADAGFVTAVERIVGDLGIVAFSGVDALAEISAPGVTKGAALRRWCAEHEIAAEHVWAFGDMPNDLPMLRWAGRSFGVAGGHPQVLAEASDVCPGNDEDGVAQILEAL